MKELLGVTCVLTFVGLFGLVAWAMFDRYVLARRRHLVALEAARARYGGALHTSWWAGDALRFEVDGVRAELTYQAPGDKKIPWTRLHLDWSGPRLRIAPETRWTGLRKFFGTQDIQVGDRRFDDTFLVQGDSEAWVREALSVTARAQLLALHVLGSYKAVFSAKLPGVTLDVTPAGVIVRCPRNLVDSERDLLHFLELALETLDQLRLAAGARVRVAISVGEASGGGRCPVCSDDSDVLSKRCAGCGATYHPECWDYLGGCAIFGCGDRYRSDAPRAKSF
ncbi:MAG: hypothetical protein R3F62_00545 [Planctomycetota bacterium]